MNDKMVALLVQEMGICDKYLELAIENKEDELSGFFFMLSDETDRRVSMLAEKLKERGFIFPDELKEKYNEHVTNKHVRTHLFHSPVTGLMD